MDVLSTYSYRIGEMLPDFSLIPLLIVDLSIKALAVVALILIVKVCLVYLKKNK